MIAAGYQVVQSQVFDDASSVTVQLDCNGHRVCATYVAGSVRCHVPQNKTRTARMSRQQEKAARDYINGILRELPAIWHANHAAMYATGSAA
jgi:hypothetical protein